MSCVFCFYRNDIKIWSHFWSRRHQTELKLHNSTTLHFTAHPQTIRWQTITQIVICTSYLAVLAKTKIDSPKCVWTQFARWTPQNIYLTRFVMGITLKTSGRYGNLNKFLQKPWKNACANIICTQNNYILLAALSFL